MKLGNPAGRVERLGFLKGGPGFTIIPTGLFRFRRELGLDRNTLLVLLSVLSHARATGTDFCEVAYSVIVRDTGLHRTIICNCLKVMLAPVDSELTVKKRKRSRDGKTASVKVAVRGLGLMSLAPRTKHSTPMGHRTDYLWRDGGPKFDTNVYHLAPLADRLEALLRPKSSGAVGSHRFGTPRFDCGAEAGPEDNGPEPLAGSEDFSAEAQEDEEPTAWGPRDDTEGELYHHEVHDEVYNDE